VLTGTVDTSPWTQYGLGTCPFAVGIELTAGGIFLKEIQIYFQSFF
jgi:hypothetical protein